MYKIIVGKENKNVDTMDEAWDDMDQKAQFTLELCLADEVMYNVMTETSMLGV